MVEQSVLYEVGRNLLNHSWAFLSFGAIGYYLWNLSCGKYFGMNRLVPITQEEQIINYLKEDKENTKEIILQVCKEPCLELNQGLVKKLLKQK